MKTIVKVFSADFVSKIIMTITTILLIRFMDDSAYANYAVLTAIVNIYSQIANTAIGKMYIVNYDELKGNEFCLLLLQIIIGMIIAVIFIPIQNTARFYIVSLLELMITTCIFSFARVIYQQQCRFRFYSALELLRVIIFLFSITGYYLVSKDLFSIELVVLIQSISLGSSVFFLKSTLSNIKWKVNKNDMNVIKVLLSSEQINLIIYSVLLAILLQIDVLMLKSFTSDNNVATYASALKYYNIILMVTATVNSVLLPQVTIEKNYIKIRKLFKQMDFLSFILGIGVLFAIIIAPYILPILDGGKYPESIGVFRILCISAFISFLGSPYCNILMKERKFFKLNLRIIFAIIVSITLNYLLIPIFNEFATAWITLFSYGFVNLGSRYSASKIIRKKLNNYHENNNI